MHPVVLADTIVDGPSIADEDESPFGEEVLAELVEISTSMIFLGGEHG
jgi:hypothetical protein